MLVNAAKGLSVPKESKPHDYITDTPPKGAKGVAVPESAYYLRRIADGDLIVVPVNQTTKGAA